MENAKLTITSEAFADGQMIPQRFTCDGKNINPPLRIQGFPGGTKSMVLIVDDPDAPRGTWDHWVVWNIPRQEDIPEETVPGIEGLNSFKQHHYGGPCPPSGTHRYFFKVYALDTELNLSSDSQKPQVEMAMEGHILAQAQLVGLYKRQ